MINLVDKSQITLFDYLYVFSIIIYAGAATEFARSFGVFGTVGNAVALILTFVFIWKNNIHITMRFVYTLAAFTLYAVLTFIQNGVITPLWLGIWWMFFLISYSICHHFRERTFVVYETILYHLCIVALAFWCVYLVAPGVVEQIINVFQFSTSYSDDIGSKNMIVYTLMDTDRQSLSEFVALPRNAGYAWEPGAFACFVCFAIFCNIIRTGFTLKKNRHLLVFLAALLTTSSTTGYMILIAILMLWIIANGKFFHMLYIIPIAIILFQQPFVQEKMMEEYANVDDLNIAVYDEEKMHALGRFASFQLDWEEFLRHPVLGLGGYSKGTFLMQHGYDNIATISGIGKLLSRYGAIMSLLFIILLVKSAKTINKLFNTNNGWILLVVIIGSMISYDSWMQPAVMIFWTFGLWNVESKRQCYEQKI